jgi:CBS domain-containing protein
MPEVPKQLTLIAEKLKKGEPVEPATVRTLLGWFDASRRGYWIAKEIRRALKTTKLITDPDFESAYIDAPLQFSLRTTKAEPTVQPPSAEVVIDAVAVAEQEIQLPASMVVGGSIDDPTYRIGKLEAANRFPLTIKPDQALNEAVTLMLSHEYSQMPVMIGERDVKGVVSWLSIGRRTALGHHPKTVRDCMDQHQEISADRSLFAAISFIAQWDYVLVRAADNRITGIVTTADLSLQFRQLAEPFLLIGEIENHIRKMIDGKFTQPEIASVRNPDDPERAITRVSDLTFGEYIRLLEMPENWTKLKLSIDRNLFIAELQRVRVIRNDVMHFDPDGLPDTELLLLRRVARFLQQISEVGAPL